MFAPLTLPGKSELDANKSSSSTSGQIHMRCLIVTQDASIIIGKGGAKINEIRHMSASQIKIMEPGAVGVGMNGQPAPAAHEGERLVVITGQPANIQMAVQLLYNVRI